MRLSRYTLKNISGDVKLPDEAVFDLPEKVLQFGTGVLLRGLPDYFIDKANAQGLFNGRIVVIKSTSKGDCSVFEKQDGLYTLCIRGLENGEKVEQNIVNASISRVLSADKEWGQILDCAHDQNMEVIISNTTEVGIQFTNDDIRQYPPKSFPGKLLAFLYERFKAFNGSEHSGMVIVPTELIPDNGTKLQSIVLELAHLNGLEDEFIGWLENYNYFCNSLVDCIVPGKPGEDLEKELEQSLGYKDDLLTISEVYRLWAIEGGETVRQTLSFAGADIGVIIEPNIDIYRELKLRLLNGTHTLSCGLAFLAGCDTVKEAMDTESVSVFITDLMHNEIAPSIPYELDLLSAHEFGNKVLDRFRNPNIRHQWINITMQYSSKMKTRCIPILLQHYKKYETVPEHIALGFAAYLYFMKPVEVKDGQYFGSFRDKLYPIQDDQAPQFYKRWSNLSVDAVVEDVLRDAGFWGEELHILPGFQQSVLEKLNTIIHNNGIKEAIDSLPATKTIIA